MKLAFLGDTHGDLDRVARAADRAHVDGCAALIHVGDFWFSPDTLRWLAEYPFPLPVDVLDGNHERHELLPSMEIGHHPLGPKVDYIGRGTVDHYWTDPGVFIAFMGGGDSIDKGIRLRLGLHWSPLEVITDEQVDVCIAAAEAMNCVAPKLGRRPDLLVTHSPPQSIIDAFFDNSQLPRRYGVPVDWKGVGSAQRLDRLWEALGFPDLICGHMHESKVGVAGGHFQILNVGEYVVRDFGL